MHLRRSTISRITLLTVLAVLGTSTLCPAVCRASAQAESQASCHDHAGQGDEAPASSSGHDSGRVSDCCCDVILAVETPKTDATAASPAHLVAAAVLSHPSLAAVDAPSPSLRCRAGVHRCGHSPPIPLYLIDRSLLI